MLVPILLGGCGGDSSAGRRSFGASAGDGVGGSEGEPAANLTCDPDAPPAPIDMGGMTLAAAFESHFKIGVAVGNQAASGMDADARDLASQQYNRATPENAFKWQSIQPQPGQFNFNQAERFLAFAEQNGMEVHGHTIVWHQQVPGWVFQGPDGGRATREQLLERLDTHMARLAQELGGRVHYWDVVNEALEDDGSLRDTNWRQIIGDDYIEQAFALADRHFPDAKLVYNDYSMELPGKRDAAVRIVEEMKAKGIRIDAIGSQGHFRLTTPSIPAIETSIMAFAGAGVEVLMSEVDVDVLPPANNNQGADLSVNAELSAMLNPYADCLPPMVAEQAAERWGAVFELFVEHKDKVRAVTLWGLSDRHSWLNNWPVRGRTNYALLFDRELQPKNSWQAVIEASGSSL